MKTEITNIRKSNVGGVLFDFKGANIRKTQDFLTYPIANGDTKLYFQSNKRWMVLDLETKKLTLSKKGSTSWEYIRNGHIEVEVSQEDIETLLDKIRTLSNNGKSFIKVDNSGAKFI